MNFMLNDFEGPLDLLLHLIKQSKMDIMDIEIESITNQYLEFIEREKKMNLEVASEYLVMASELLEIKSKLLLPKKETKENDEVEEDPREELINRLLEYEAYKEITKTLKEKELLRHEIYTKSPSNIHNYFEEKVEIQSDVTLDDLIDAYGNFLQRKEANKPLHTKVTEKEISVTSRRREIKSILKSKKKVNFFDLFETTTREYVVATFLAILEMAKEKELKIKQENNFSEIICEVM